MSHLVSFEDAALGYGNTPALSGLTLDVDGGQALALVGPNGGGKTTLTNLILVGNGSDTEGVRLRRGTGVNINNAVFCNKGKILVVESEQTENLLKNGDSSIKNTTISGTVNSEKNIWNNDSFLASEGNSVDSNLSLSLDDIKAQYTWLSGSWVK